MPLLAPPPDPDFAEQRLSVSAGVGWPEIGALDVRFRPEPRIGVGAWFAISGPLVALYATPMAYFRHYMGGTADAFFVQFGAGSRLRGLFGGEPLQAAPLLLASYGYEWRLPGGLNASIDGGGVFDFALSGASPVLRLGLRLGWSAL
ncbi:MAG: hypothetical protein FJZ01_18885 [Candidatus Sericytochromatia bacterium]|nr:hypothetical protein [Candidatus Tanganyikabacteria bacterium]